MTESGETGATSTTLPNCIVSFHILMTLLRALFSQAEVFLDVHRTIQWPIVHRVEAPECYVSLLLLFPRFSFNLSVQFVAGSLDEHYCLFFSKNPVPVLKCESACTQNKHLTWRNGNVNMANIIQIWIKPIVFHMFVKTVLNCNMLSIHNPLLNVLIFFILI